MQLECPNDMIIKINAMLEKNISIINRKNHIVKITFSANKLSLIYLFCNCANIFFPAVEIRKIYNKQYRYQFSFKFYKHCPTVYHYNSVNRAPISWFS